MSDLMWLSEAQIRRIEPYFPLSHGVPRVDDRRIIFVIGNGLRWRGCACAIRPTQNDLQSLRSLEQAGLEGSCRAAGSDWPRGGATVTMAI